MIPMRRLIPALAAVVVFALAPAWAQGAEGKLSGVARDTTGAGIPGVTVTAMNQATNASQTTTTATDGSYSLSPTVRAARSALRPLVGAEAG